jgi:hypothetical protein
MSTIEQVRRASVRTETARQRLLDFAEGRHEHDGPARQRLIDELNESMQAYIRTVVEYANRNRPH